MNSPIFDLTNPDTSDVVYSRITFPDGQTHISLKHTWVRSPEIIIRSRITNPNDLFEIAMVKELLDSQLVYETHLVIKYLMGARMDRPIDNKSPFTLKTVTDIINSLDFTRVTVLDPHSDVTPALINKCSAIGPDNYVKKVMEEIGYATFVGPDAGAAKKVEKLAIANNMGYVQCLKTRDMQTGELSGFKVASGDINPNDKYLIVDDICDGGATFKGLASELRSQGANSVLLYVTHGIFSKGFDIEGVDHIYTTNSYQTFTDVPDHVTVLE